MPVAARRLTRIPDHAGEAPALGRRTGSAETTPVTAMPIETESTRPGHAVRYDHRDPGAVVGASDGVPLSPPTSGPRKSWTPRKVTAMAATSTQGSPVRVSPAMTTGPRIQPASVMMESQENARFRRRGSAYLTRTERESPGIPPGRAAHRAVVTVIRTVERRKVPNAASATWRRNDDDVMISTSRRGRAARSISFPDVVAVSAPVKAYTLTRNAP